MRSLIGSRKLFNSVTFFGLSLYTSTSWDHEKVFNFHGFFCLRISISVTEYLTYIAGCSCHPRKVSARCSQNTSIYSNGKCSKNAYASTGKKLSLKEFFFGISNNNNNVKKLQILWERHFSSVEAIIRTTLDVIHINIDKNLMHEMKNEMKKLHES